MAHSFRSRPAKPTFGNFLEPLYSSEYIYNKKAKTIFCAANKCVPSTTVGSQSNLLLLNRANKLKYYACRNSFNNANLNINLITKLNLTDVPVISNSNTNETPTTITTLSVPYLDYIIDPSGVLFGNTICGINNYENFLEYNPPYTSKITNL
jgi:hypothetical protein